MFWFAPSGDDFRIRRALRGGDSRLLRARDHAATGHRYPSRTHRLADAEGLKELDRELIEMARSFTRSPIKVFWRITVPLLMPYVVAALRIAYGVGWKIALVAELFGTESGLGFLMLRAQTLSDAATVFAACFAVVILFIAFQKALVQGLSVGAVKG